MISLDSESFEVDPFASIRPGLSAEHAGLEAGELAAVLGPVPATLALHHLLNSKELRDAALATLLGQGGPRSVRINGVDISIAAYLRTVARLCRQVAEQSEGETPQFEQLIGPGGVPVALGASVGQGGKNNSDDVKLIQRLLNFNLPLPASPLPENGILDAATISAIEDFQRFMFGAGTPDGKVEPRKATFEALATDKLSFLPHRCQPLAGASVPLDAAQMNPGFLTATGVNRDSSLQAIVDRRVLGTAGLDRLRFALVDLTGEEKLAHPQFAGHQETVQGGLGSMSKVATMYAAYQLKFDLEELSRQRGITNQKDLFIAARDLWNDAQKPNPTNATAIFPAAPKIETQGKLVVIDGKPVAGVSGLSVPALERIFASVPGAISGLTLRFIGSDRIQVDPGVPNFPPDETAEVLAYIRRRGEALNEVRKLSFAERLFLMIDDSDNAAAHSCIENVGFLFTASAIWQSDFYRPQRGGGLWEASTHDKDGKRWIKPPVPQRKPGADFVSATPCSIAALFTLIEQRRLVNREACMAMKHLLDKKKTGVTRGSHTRSYFKEGLSSFTLDRIHSKLGIGDFLNDAAIIERTVRVDPADPAKDKKIRYVAAGFDDPSPAKAGVPAKFLNRLIVELDKCIRENNGLLSPSAP